MKLWPPANPDSDPNGLWVIYGLFEPKGSCRYIGTTRRALGERLRQHLSLSGSNDQKRRWIAGLLVRGQVPRATVFGSVRGNYATARRCETVLSRWFTSRGHRLLNRESRAHARLEV